ncbi:MAG: serine hydrolase [Bacteroidetes bacterium]|nr:serine hydrolase [Bacteroidota bacterium]
MISSVSIASLKKAVDISLRHYSIVILLLSFFSFTDLSFAQTVQPKTDDLIERIMKAHPEKFKNILESPQQYRVQIIYTQIKRDKNNLPHFSQHTYHLNKYHYFYPASLVKLPVAALSLEKINRLKADSLKYYPKLSALFKETRMKIDSTYYCQSVVEKDSTSETGFPSIAHYIKKMMLVSDNDAYTHLYEFLGQEYANNRLWEKGYTSARIIHRLKMCDTLQNRYTNPILFLHSGGDTIYNQRMQYNPQQLKKFLGVVKVGKKNIENGKLVAKPKEFTYNNYLCLQDINDVLLSIMFPQAAIEKKRFQLITDDYHFLRKYMSMYPTECNAPKYDSANYHDCYKKYLFYGNSKDSITDKNIRIFNVVGQSYGFLSDVAYIADFQNKIEFAISAVIYVNSDGILNDGKYEYDTIGFPFLANLSRAIYEYEKKRSRSTVPDLSEFKIDY